MKETTEREKREKVCAWPNPQQHTIIYLASQAKPHQLTKTRLSHPTGRKTKMTFLSALNASRILFVIHSLVSFPKKEGGRKRELKPDTSDIKRHVLTL